MQNTNNLEKYLELATKDLNQWTKDEILNVVKVQFEDAYLDTLGKKEVWQNMLKLYMNQYKKGVNDIKLGSRLIFTQFHETYSAIDNDDITVEFKARHPKDYKKVLYTNAVARFDFDEMGKADVQRDVNWNVILFGTAILDVSTYDKDEKVLKIKNQSPFTFFVDNLANSIEEARYAGRFVYKTYYELLQDGRLDESEVKKLTKTPQKQYGREVLNMEREAKRILIGNKNFTEPIHPNILLEILEWYFYNNGKLWVVWTDNAVNTLLGYEEVDYKDGANGVSKIPFVIYRYIKTGLSFWGLGLPEVIEDYHRADVLLKNLMFQGVKLDSTPTFLFNVEALINPKHLMTREVNKSIPTKVPPQGQIVPFPKTQVVSNDTISFLNILQNEAVGAVGSSRILKGSLTQVKKSATEIAIAKAKQDLLLSSLMRNIVAGEKDFWMRWLKRHDRFLEDDSTKLVELIGYHGAKDFKEIRKKDFVPEQDPGIEITSSLVLEPQKVVRRRDLAEMLPIIAQSGGNVKEGLKMLLQNLDLLPEQIDIILTPSPHEIKARMENEMLEKNQYVEVHEEDNDIEHINEHYKAKPTKSVSVHINAHLSNILRKQKIASSQEKTKAPIEMAGGQNVLETLKRVQEVPEIEERAQREAEQASPQQILEQSKRLLPNI